MDMEYNILDLIVSLRNDVQGVFKKIDCSKLAGYIDNHIYLFSIDVYC